VIDEESACKLSDVFGKPLRELAKRGSSAPDSSQDDAVGSALRGTLYELACIHQRIVTLEEHSARVKKLEHTIEEQGRSLEAVKAELHGAILREATARAEASAIRAECAAIRGSSPSIFAQAASLLGRAQKRPRTVSIGD
jgi:hypothetical protein